MTNWLARLRGHSGANPAQGGGVRAATAAQRGKAGRMEPFLPHNPPAAAPSSTRPPTHPHTGHGGGKRRLGLSALSGFGGHALEEPSPTIQDRAAALFLPYQPPRGVRGAGAAALAMDEGLGAYASAQYGMVSSFVEQGLAFKGYPTLAAMMLRAEFRKPVEIIAREATRAWIRFRCNGVQADATQTAARLRAVEVEFQRLHVRDVVRRQIVHGLGFGVGHIWVGLRGVPLNDAGQAVPLCLTPHGMARGQLERLVNIDPIWTTPNSYNADNPLRADYYRPADWWVQGVLVNSSRLLSVVPFEVPDILKPAFNFGGLALPQMLETYVHNFLRTRQSVSDMVSNFATKILKTDMSGTMQSDTGVQYADIDAQSVTARVAAMNAWQSNNGTFVLDRESEDFDIKSAPLSGLAELQAQSQEFMAGIPGIPLVKLFGIQPQGLNASSQGEIRVFYDEIAAFQEAHMAPVLRALFHLVQLNLWGRIDPDLDFEFVPLWQMSEQEAAAVEKTKTDMDTANILSGKITPHEARAREAADAQSLYRTAGLAHPMPGGGPDADFVKTPQAKRAEQHE
ncbi:MULTISPECIES: DUF1073 domain-containing protein [Acetobacter]|uniref:phage portal protein n=2 Tax=Acetobacteraceae TaxID=433 RepID=UPI00209D654F|nr:DUF1073 domain-containing protein [Acetobacter lovaniensis]MCI1697804.1 DUF1073 domain-containing protein [Acetobacter lovaniensis]MCI1795829.1 DUF1073 domain-containing protein [Acetobacter lovaniensis]MCP1239434.1 DUF1073 domain-containing protein [Acetobacter lovaniensis]